MKQYSATVGKLVARRVGTWNKTTQFFNELGFDVRSTANRAIRTEMHEFRRKLIFNIVTQAFRGQWPALSKKYSQNKKQNKNMIYMNTEKYINNLVVKYTNDRAYVGFRKGVSYRRKGKTIPIDLVARWMEYGAGNVPARPLWGPTFNQMGGTKGVETRISDKIYRHLKNKSRGTGIKINKGNIRK